MTDEGALAGWQLADTVALNVALAAALGALVSSVWLQHGRSPWALRSAASLRTALRAALVLTALASLGALWLQAAVMAEVPLSQALPAIVSVLAHSHYGRAWLAGAAGLAVASAAAFAPAGASTGRRGALGALGVAVFVLGRSVVSHAGSHGDATWAVAVDAVHLLLVGLWAGEVFIGAWVMPATCGEADRADRVRWVRALSSSATLALGGVVATGAFNAWRGTGGSVDRLVGTAYGGALGVKLALVAVAVVLGGVNRFVVMPQLLEALRSGRLAVEPPLRRFVSILRVESAVLAVALGAAAVLAASPPPGAG